MRVLPRNLRRECLLRRGCEGHTGGGALYIHAEIHAPGFEVGELLLEPPNPIAADSYP